MYNAPFTVPAILLALVLIVSGVAKLVNLSTASDAFVSLRLPQFLVKLKAPTLLPFGELVLAAGLLLTSGIWQVLFAIAALALFIAYLIVIVRALTFNEKVTCSCFGKLGLGSVDVFTAVRNLILVGLAGLALADAIHSRSVIARMNDFSGGDWCWLAGVLAAVVLTWLISGHRGDEPVATPLQTDDEYRRWPIPFMTLHTPTDQAVTLRDLARNEPVMLLNVSPTCGSCVDTIEHARAWQHTVSGLRTCLVLPMPVSSNAVGLKDPDDFDILYDPNYEFGKLFQTGTPTAVLLGADGLLAGGPVTGKSAISEFLDDVAEELTAQHATLNENPDDPAQAEAVLSTSTESTVASNTPVRGTPTEIAAPTTAVAEAPLIQDAEADAEEYFRQPTPYAMLTRGDEQNYSLLALGDAGPTVFLSVSPGCGSCQDVIAQGPTWEKELRGVHLYYLVPAQGSVEPLVERGIETEKIFFDPNYHLQSMMGLSTPSMFAIGPDRKLLAGPVSGSLDVAAIMDDIIAEVAGVREENTESVEEDISAQHDSVENDSVDSIVTPTPAGDDHGITGPTSTVTVGSPVPAQHLINAHGDSPNFEDGRERLLVFLSPGCEACHDVATRIEAWRGQLPHKRLEVVVPGSADDFDPAMYAPGTPPDLFDPTYAFGEALGIQTPALVELDGAGRLLTIPASSQSECYAAIRRLRAEAV